MRMADLARTAAAPRSVEDVLSDVTAAALELVPGTDTAGVLLIGKGGKWDSLGGTSDLPHLLDELQMKYNEGPCVEAALDDTNLHRLLGLFELLRAQSQLLIITHQKPTMEVADALYGVTMQGDGITAVISQRMRGQQVEQLVGNPS